MKKEQLENIRSKTMEGVLIRSKARWIGEGEKTSQYFCNLEKRHYTSKRMTSLIKDNGIETNDNDEIVNEVRTFYKQFYINQEMKLLKMSISSHVWQMTLPSSAMKRHKRWKEKSLMKKQEQY